MVESISRSLEFGQIFLMMVLEVLFFLFFLHSFFFLFFFLLQFIFFFEDEAAIRFTSEKLLLSTFMAVEPRVTGGNISAYTLIPDSMNMKIKTVETILFIDLCLINT